MNFATNRVELLQIADAVAREKLIPRGVILSLIEEAIARAARSLYGSDHVIRASIHPQTGHVRLIRVRTIVANEADAHDSTGDRTQDGNRASEDTLEDSALGTPSETPLENGKPPVSPSSLVPLSEARMLDPHAEVGGEIQEELPPIDFGRIAARAAKQIIVQGIRDAERERQYEEFKDRVGDIISGVARRIEHGNVIIDIGTGEAILRRTELIPRESFRVGDRVRSYIYNVKWDAHGYQVFLSRARPEFVKKLFMQEVPEIYDGIIEIRAVARDQGSRTKVAVWSRDPSIDPVGACVGVRGSRVQAIVSELQEEKIEIVQWDEDPVSFIVNAMAPAEISKVILDEDAHRVEAVMAEDQFSVAIGRRGQNVRLASRLTGWDIDVLTEDEESKRRQGEFAQRTQTFMDNLGIDETLAQLFASEGFRSITEIAYVEPSEIAEVTGFDEKDVQAIQEKAEAYLARQQKVLEQERKELGVTDDLAQFSQLTNEALVALGKQNIKTLEDLAGCASDDLVGFKNEQNERVPGYIENMGLTRGQIDDLIISAREHLGWIRKAPDSENRAK